MNIVVNPSFETALRFKINEFSRKKNGENLVHGWNVPTSGTPDYFDYPGSRVYWNRMVKARTDSGRIGMIAGLGRRKFSEFFKYPKGYAEYIQGSFARPLKKGETYCVSFFTAQHPDSKFSVKNMGALISAQPVKHQFDYAPLFMEPDIKSEKYITPDLEWFEVKGSYTAKGGEQYITIGNWGIPEIKKTKKITGEKMHVYSIFNPSSYYFVDDVSVRIQSEDQYCTQKPQNQVVMKDSVHYFFLLDVSGSMNGKKYIDSVRFNLPSAIKKLSPESKISLLSFANEVKEEFLFKSVNESPLDSSFWENIEVGGITSYNKAIEKAYEMIDTNSVYETTIVLVSDGSFKVKTSLVEKVQQNHQNFGIHFSIMMMGDQIIPGDMLQLSTLSKGRAVRFDENDFNDLILDKGYKVSKDNKVTTSEHSKAMAFVIKAFKPLMLTVVAVGLYFTLR